MARLAAVVLNWRTPDATLACARALLASTRPIDHLIVVDNGSGDGGRLARELPSATVIAAPKNLGFSGGANLGITAALDGGADLVLLANSDLYVDPDCLGRLEAALAAQAELGIVGPQIVTHARPDRVESLGISWSPSTGRVLNLGAGERRDGRARLSHVDAVSGALMLIRREVLARVGRFDEEYFFSLEDVDFCLRAGRAGFAIACVPAAVAEHEGSRSIGARSSRRVYFATRNHLRLAASAPAPFGPAHALARQGLVAAANLAYVLARSPAPAGARLAAFARGVWHHLRRRYGDDAP